MPETENKNPAGFLKLVHKKSGFFRTIHADGAWGGLNTAGVIFLTFYAEHSAIPSSVSYPMDKDGNVTNDMLYEGEDVLDREMEVNIALTIPAALQVRQTLDNFIKTATAELTKLQQKLPSVTNPTGK